jgi:peptidylprolyl isomerase
MRTASHSLLRVAEIKDDVVVLDANHSLAGKELVFDIELVEILK